MGFVNSDKKFVARENEVGVLLDSYNRNQSDFVAVVGRRRVGKTFLIKNAYKNKISFQFTGIKDASREVLLKEFMKKLTEVDSYFENVTTPSNWLEALHNLKLFLKKKSKKKVVFLDELPWIDGHKSGFLSALEYFWNDWAVDQNMVIVVCGSSTSWMIKHIVNNRGGLHNRITKYINLKPFTIAETEELFLAKGIKMPKYEIVQIYMAVGGVPYYLNEVVAGESALQNIDRMIFSENSTLKNEYRNLYRALFDNYENYEKIVKALSIRDKGLTRSEIIEETKLTNGGGLTRMLTELEESTFIKTYRPFGKTKKETLYRLIDEYSVFYHHFYSPKSTQGSFLKLSTTIKYKVWAGFAFETLCFRHIDKIKEALGISGVYSDESAFFFKGNDEEEGFQIDLLIDRADNAINICEMKFYNDELRLSKNDCETLRKRRESFRTKSKTKKYLINTIITTFGFKQNEYSTGIVDAVIPMERLF
jgi:AAA+ ATPase superfamily predicted ATPase